MKFCLPGGPQSSEVRSGAAASANATSVALRTLVDLFCITLKDSKSAKSTSAQRETTADSALRMLQEMQVDTAASKINKTQQQTQVSAQSKQECHCNLTHVHSGILHVVIGPEIYVLVCQFNRSGTYPCCEGNGSVKQQRGSPSELMVKIDVVWQANTAKKLEGRLPMMLEPLQSHPQPAVRGALASGRILHSHSISAYPARCCFAPLK